MILKIVLVLLLLFIIYSLGSALFYLIKDGGKSDRVVKALTWRIGLSLLVFILLIIGASLGWIHPHGVG